MRTRDDKTESEDIAEARSRIVNGALIFISIIAVPALAASFYRLETIGWQPIMALHASAAAGDLGDYSVPQPGALSSSRRAHRVSHLPYRSRRVFDIRVEWRRPSVFHHIH